METLALTGVHHVSTLSAQINSTHRFYRHVMGMRPIITTVNQDDTSMYHLFYGDGAGTPGSDITIFDLPHASRERRGNNSVTRTGLRVTGAAALDYWAARLSEFGVQHSGVIERDGRLVLHFEDSVGTQLALIDDGGVGTGVPWEESDVPTAYQVRGLGYVEMMVPALEPTDTFLSKALGLQADHTYIPAEAPHSRVHVYRIGEGGPHAEVHVLVRDDVQRARYGSGGVHHVALRVPIDEQIGEWAERLNALGYRNSGVIDRHYFQSVYVREPNHVLFELATDGPGFDVDGPIDGERLTLPPSLEPRRAEIAARLQPIERM